MVRGSQHKKWRFGMVALCILMYMVMLPTFLFQASPPPGSGSSRISGIRETQPQPSSSVMTSRGVLEKQVPLILPLVGKSMDETGITQGETTTKLDLVTPKATFRTVLTPIPKTQLAAMTTTTTLLKATAGSNQELPPNDTSVHDDKPWRVAAPNIDNTEIPSWMEAYVKFHNQALQDAHLQTKDTDQHKYLVFTCRKSCSGTGNRQRAIMASFMVAMVTKRIFLIDITVPVRLDTILWPHKVRWNWFPSHLDQLRTKVLKLRNKNPPILDSPSKVIAMAHNESVIRLEANSPVNLEQQWRSMDIRAYLADFGVPRSVTVPGTLYKQIFGTLYQPSPQLNQAVVALRQQLQLPQPQTDFRYIVVHARTGGDGKSWKDNDRFTTDKLDNLFGNARMVRNGMLQQSGMNETYPIVVVSDDPNAKKQLHDMDPSIVRYADTKIIHVDRSRPSINDLDGSLAVWADILIMAQASCIVKGRGSFSMLGAWLAAGKYGSACMQLVI